MKHQVRRCPLACGSLERCKKMYVIFKKQPAFGQTRIGEYIAEDTVHFFDLREDTPEERERAKAEGYRYAYLFCETYGYYGDTRYVYVGYEIL